MNVSGEWIILGHGRPESDAYMGPGPYSEMEEFCHNWNEAQTAQERAGAAPRGTLQRFYIRRVS